MATSEVLTQEQLIVQKLDAIKAHITDWNRSGDAEFVLSKTNRGQQAFTWEARYKDGSRFFQYPEISFFRTLGDVDYIPPVDEIISTDVLDKKQTVEYTLHPTAFIRSKLPWYIRPFIVIIKPEKNERLLAFWEVDYIPRTGVRLYRNVFGVSSVDGEEKELSRSLFVLSLSGAMVMANSTDVSFEGE